MDDNLPTAQVIVLGDSSVGKSSIVLRFGRDSFEESPSTTIGAAYITKAIDVNSPNSSIKKLAIHLWDTAGQERFRSIIPMYVRGSNAILIVCSADNEDSYRNDTLNSWLSLVDENASDVKTRFIVMNKIDIKKDNYETVSKNVQNFANEKGCEFMEVSAKENIGIADLFELVAKKILENGEKLLSDGGNAPKRTPQPKETNPKDKKKCC